MKLRPIVLVAAAVGGAAVLARKVGIHEDLDWQSVDKPGLILDVNGYRVHYVDEGAGPAIVLIHGFGGHTYSYRHVIPDLARDHRVIAVDLKGYGYSERAVDTGLSRTAQVSMLKGLLDRLGIDHAVFVGHSMGGGVVQRLAVLHPELVNALVLAASVSAEDRVGHRAHRALPPAPLLKLTVPVLAKFAATRILRGSFYDPSKLTEDVRDGYMRPIRIKGSMDVLMSLMRESGDDAEIDITRIGRPVLLLYGAHDKIVPVSVGQGLQERIPHARMVVIDNAGHLLFEEQPELCLSAMRDFLTEGAIATAEVSGAS